MKRGNRQRLPGREQTLTEAVPGILFTGQEAGVGEAPLFVGISLVLMAMVLVSVIYR